ncbi:hypothetical protein V7S43_009957 [Phytophthora oleae]|uniref:BZIP domain-containing protein n=1 Tax=Phytophthora oleae TaxID=2107226 RepID=A0ABD3FFU2_9STRA
MTTSDAALLAEVETFLSECDSPTLHVPSIEAQDIEGSTTKTTALSDLPSQHQANVRGRRRLKSSGDPKREREKAKDRERRAEYRERRLKERTDLLRQVKELTAELEESQKAKEATASMSSTAWKLLAQRLKHEREEAEEHQQRLRAEVNARSTLVKDIYYRLASHYSANMGDALQRNRMRLHKYDMNTFMAYVGELDALYDKTDEMFRDSNCKDCGEWNEDAEEGSYHYKDRNIVPIGFQQASDALWEASHLPQRQSDRQEFNDTEDSDNTAAFKFRLTARLGNGRVVSVVQCSVTRRYQEDNRLAVIWRSFMEGEGEFAGMHADETGWDELTPTAEGTMMRTYIQHFPMLVSTLSTSKPVLQEFNGVVLEAVSDVGEEIYQRFEKLVLADS